MWKAVYLIGLHKEVNCTEPSSSVRIPCSLPIDSFSNEIFINFKKLQSANGTIIITVLQKENHNQKEDINATIG
jgi:hypothetical protein